MDHILTPVSSGFWFEVKRMFDPVLLMTGMFETNLNTFIISWVVNQGFSCNEFASETWPSEIITEHNTLRPGSFVSPK